MKYEGLKFNYLKFNFSASMLCDVKNINLQWVQ
jgi:hypothetical protein